MRHNKDDSVALPSFQLPLDWHCHSKSSARAYTRSPSTPGLRGLLHVIPTEGSPGVVLFPSPMAPMIVYGVLIIVYPAAAADAVASWNSASPCTPVHPSIHPAVVVIEKSIQHGRGASCSSSDFSVGCCCRDRPPDVCRRPVAACPLSAAVARLRSTTTSPYNI